MVTINDIAKEAGVSHGTASNVLNKRGNVRADKIKLVEEAAKKLGYRINTQAQFLRRGLSNKCYILVLSTMKNQYTDFLDEIMVGSSSFDIEIVNIRSKSNISHIFNDCLGQLPHAIFCLGFSIKKFKVSRLHSVKVYEIDTYPEKNGLSFQISTVLENFREFLYKNSINTVTFLSFGFEGDYSLSSYISESIIQNYSSKHYYLNDYDYVLKLYPSLKLLTHFDVIFLTDKFLLNRLKDMLKWFGKKDLPIFYLVGSSDFIQQDNVYTLKVDYRKLAQNCILKIENKTLHQLLPYESMSGKFSFLKENTNAIKILTLKSPISQALSILSDRYKFLTGRDIVIVEREYEEILDLLSNPELLVDIDIIRVDMAWLPTYAELIFKNISNESITKTINAKIDKSVSKEYTHVNGCQYTFPLDISSQILVYRKDIFENTLIQRQYFEKNKNSLEIPQSYIEFDKISEFFTKNINNESPTLFGHSRGLKSPIVAACDFIPRLRESLLKNNMTLSIIETVFLDYKNSINYTKKSSSDWWEDFVNSLKTGETVMEILFSNYASPLFNDDSIDTEFTFGYAPIPGNQPVIGGGAIGILKSSKMVNEALEYIDWLFSEEISVALALLGGFLPSKYVVNNTNLNKNFPWLEQFDKTFSVGSRIKWFDFETDLQFERLLGEELIKKMKNNQ
ncbi:extracellular solute-binding protein [Streptococcus sp. CSL10205-OR2]|uniref:extracellular solute-binding protein n=1 Tax=Streptococcus sp. CSL10205-OR2 TaxID=2980558 RepID=UPI0021DA2537|nr:extracellular solute-binding protein [Streptococcus sp. CSL10205-OR2]MCU9534163.1 extracellular solute-binding protein [Streptococcus sp. CSL10205-OR2]